MSRLGVVLLMAGFATFLYAVASHLVLLIVLKKRGLYLPFLLWGNQIFFLQFEYLKGRGPYRSRRLDLVARSTLLAPFVGIALVFAGLKIPGGLP
jgi:hypothetical protein